MNELTVLSDGYAGIQEYMSSIDRSYDLAKSYLPACRALDAFYLTHGKKTYDPVMNEKYREHIDHQVKNGIFSERDGRCSGFVSGDYRQRAGYVLQTPAGEI